MTEATSRRGWLTWALGLSLAFNLAFVAAFAFAEYRSRCGGCKTPAPPKTALKLTPEQSKALREGRAKLEADLAPLREKMAQHCHRLSEILASPDPDRAAIREETAAMAELQRQVQEMILEHHLAERASLPPEQQGCLSGLMREGLCGSGACGKGPGSPPCGKAGHSTTDCGPKGPGTTQTPPEGESR